MSISPTLVESPATISRILIVDDDPSNCKVISKLLSLRGYQVDTAYDGPSALDLVDRRSYGLALIDYRMPGMNGVELYRRIRQVRPGMVGVFLTGYPTIDTVFPAIEAGVQRVLAKPAVTEELFAVVEQYLGRPNRP